MRRNRHVVAGRGGRGAMAWGAVASRCSVPPKSNPQKRSSIDRGVKGMNGKRIGTVVKIALTVAGVLLVAKLGLSLVKPDGDAAVKPPFQVAEVHRGTLETLVSSTGTLAAVETVDVGTQVSGTISRLAVDFNDRVKKGQVLAVLDQPCFRPPSGRPRQRYKKPGRSSPRPRTNSGAINPCSSRGLSPNRNFFPYQTGVATAKADLASAQAGLKRARTNLAYAVIRSPIDGHHHRPQRRCRADRRRELQHPHPVRHRQGPREHADRGHGG